MPDKTYLELIADGHGRIAYVWHVLGYPWAVCTHAGVATEVMATEIHRRLIFGHVDGDHVQVFPMLRTIKPQTVTASMPEGKLVGSDFDVTIDQDVPHASPWWTDREVWGLDGLTTIIDGREDSTIHYGQIEPFLMTDTVLEVQNTDAGAIFWNTITARVAADGYAIAWIGTECLKITDTDIGGAGELLFDVERGCYRSPIQSHVPDDETGIPLLIVDAPTETVSGRGYNLWAVPIDGDGAIMGTPWKERHGPCNGKVESKGGLTTVGCKPWFSWLDCELSPRTTPAKLTGFSFSRAQYTASTDKYDFTRYNTDVEGGAHFPDQAAHLVIREHQTSPGLPNYRWVNKKIWLCDEGATVTFDTVEDLIDAVNAELESCGPGVAVPLHDSDLLLSEYRIVDGMLQWWLPTTYDADVDTYGGYPTWAPIVSGAVAFMLGCCCISNIPLAKTTASDLMDRGAPFWGSIGLKTSASQGAIVGYQWVLATGIYTGQRVGDNGSAYEGESWVSNGLLLSQDESCHFWLIPYFKDTGEPCLVNGWDYGQSTLATVFVVSALAQFPARSASYFYQWDWTRASWNGYGYYPPISSCWQAPRSTMMVVDDTIWIDATSLDSLITAYPAGSYFQLGSGEISLIPYGGNEERPYAVRGSVGASTDGTVRHILELDNAIPYQDDGAEAALETADKFDWPLCFGFCLYGFDAPAGLAFTFGSFYPTDLWPMQQSNVVESDNLSELIQAFFGSTDFDIEFPPTINLAFVPDALRDAGHSYPTIDWDQLDELCQPLIPGWHRYRLRASSDFTLGGALWNELLYHGVTPTWERRAYEESVILDLGPAIVTTGQWQMRFRRLGPPSITDAAIYGRSVGPHQRVFGKFPSEAGAPNKRYSDVHVENTYSLVDDKPLFNLETKNKRAWVRLRGRKETLELPTALSIWTADAIENFASAPNNPAGLKLVGEHLGGILEILSLPYPEIAVGMASNAGGVLAIGREATLTDAAAHDPLTNATGLSERNSFCKSLTIDLDKNNTKGIFSVALFSSRGWAPALPVDESAIIDGDYVSITSLATDPADNEFADVNGQVTDLFYFSGMYLDSATAEFMADPTAPAAYEVIVYKRDSTDAAFRGSIATADVDLAAGSCILFLDAGTGAWDVGARYVVQLDDKGTNNDATERRWVFARRGAEPRDKWGI